MPCGKHRTTITHFLNHSRWEDDVLEQILKERVVQTIYEEAERTGKPIICIVDDTIASKTKPSLQAMHPMEAAYFHQSHLKKKQDYGHQAAGVMLACNGIVLTYAIVMYDKSRSLLRQRNSCGGLFDSLSTFLVRHGRYGTVLRSPL